jgi:hypothetical protein
VTGVVARMVEADQTYWLSANSRSALFALRRRLPLPSLRPVKQFVERRA